VLKVTRHIVIASLFAGCMAPEPPRVNPEFVPTPAPSQARTGVLVMAHGGSDTWNDAVREAVAPLENEMPTAIAFGMADPATLQTAVDQLEASGVERIAVIRLFVSGSSFLHRTEYVFQQRSDPPPRGASAQSDPPARIRTSSEIVIDRHGLVDAPEAGKILLDRANALSRDTSTEVLLVLGHGNEEESVNNHLLQQMDLQAAGLRASGFRDVAVETLREDWATHRASAETRIRTWVSNNSEAGLRVLVIPFRLFGFGPYAEVLEGLEYETDALGFLPHAEITNWLRRRMRAVSCESGWADQTTACPIVTEVSSVSTSGTGTG